MSDTVEDPREVVPVVEAESAMLDPDYEEEWDEEDEDSVVIRAKWTMEEAKTLTEAAEMLKEYAQYLLDLEAQGWQLTDPVNDDYGFIKKS